MRLCFLDTETLTLDPRNPQNVLMTEIAGVVIDTPSYAALAEWGYGPLLAGLESGTFDPETELVGQEPFVTYFSHNLSILEQILAGRRIDRKTYDFRLRTNANLENGRVVTQPNKATLESVNETMRGCAATFVRGADFDITLLGNHFAEHGIKEGFHHASPQCIRSWANARLDDGVISGLVTSERIGSWLTTKKAPKSLIDDAHQDFKRLEVLRKKIGHEALNDVLIDLIMLTMIEHYRKALAQALSSGETRKS